MLALLLGLRLAESAVEKIHRGPLTLLLTALIALAIGESIARSGWITVKYNRDVVSAAVPSEI